MRGQVMQYNAICDIIKQIHFNVIQFHFKFRPSYDRKVKWIRMQSDALMIQKHNRHNPTQLNPAQPYQTP